MRLLLAIGSLLVGGTIIFQARYKIMNTLLAVSVLRKLIVTISMNMPFIRKRLLPMIMGRSTT
ncbi:hypothetical protein NC797_10690 [Aquibacillus sp. 3ASR75-11]|uniref:Uncharacterized protein n=1 Tax=Terrihalobacillus insolitus TaxID=2950438 RepID=A0A9X4AM23_9BACI|nr:hypothetical protein [Terrihalobacillus insolitus]MDC3413389.1 hypothetical protein [Terrihalobacillus insolitus]MDC3424972.1 hypothetical protein [Terrihalobacillus insolitus]